MKRIILPFVLLAGMLLAACDTGTATNTPTGPTATTAAAAVPATTSSFPLNDLTPLPSASDLTPTAAMTGTAPTAATSAVSPTTAPTPGPTAVGINDPAFPAGGPIPIGIAVAQTSNTALLGQEEVVGAQIAETFFNGKGGVNGTLIKLIYQDTGGDEIGANNAFLTLINTSRVLGIVGPTLSQQAFSADRLADTAKVPVLGPSNTAKGIPQIGDYIARVSAPVAVVAPKAVDAALKLNPNIKKVAVFYAQNDAFSKSETGTFQDTVKNKGLNLVTVQKFQTTDTDFQTQVTAALNVQPDLCIVSGLAADGGNLVKQLRELGYTGLIIGGNGLNTTNIFPVCGASCDGILIAQAYSPQAPGEVNAAFRAAYKALKGKEPPQFSAQAFTGVQVFVDALNSLDKKSKLSGMTLGQARTALNTEILAGKYDTPLGPISFDKVGEVQQTQFYVAQIKMNPDGTTGSFNFIK